MERKQEKTQEERERAAEESLSERASLAAILDQELQKLEELGSYREAIDSQYGELMRQDRVFHSKPRSALSASARPTEDLDELNARSVNLKRVAEAKTKVESMLRSAWQRVRASAAVFGVSLAGELPSGPVAGVRAAIRSAGCPLPSHKARGRDAA